MITEMNESNTLTKHISCKCKYKLDGTKCKSNPFWNNENIDARVKNIIYVKKNYVLNPAICNCEN